MKAQIYLHTFLETQKGTKRAMDIVENDILFGVKGPIRILDTRKTEIETLSILMKSGEKVIIPMESSLLTEAGVKDVSELKEGDFLSKKFFTKFRQKKGSEKLSWETKLRVDSIPIKIPTEMSEALAYWLGMMIAKGRNNKQKGIVGFELTEKRKEELIYFKHISKELFNVTFQEVVYGDRSFVEIISMDLSKWIVSMIGKGSLLKKIPQEILIGSIEEQIAFIRGLSFNSYVDGTYLVPYCGASPQIAKFVSYVLSKVGYVVSERVKQSGNNKKV